MTNGAAAGETFGAGCGCELAIPEPAPRNEAFIVPCDVSYSGQGAPTLDVVEHSGLWSVIANALSFDYLWNEVRVKGGAYGVGFRRGEEGFARFYSYRDPVSMARSRVLMRLPIGWPRSSPMRPRWRATSWLRSPGTTRRQSRAPLLAAKTERSCAAARPIGVKKLRDEKLAATPAAIRACAPVLRKVADPGQRVRVRQRRHHPCRKAAAGSDEAVLGRFGSKPAKCS